LNQEYLYLGIFAAVFAIILGVTVDTYEMTRTDGVETTNFPYTAIAFLVGAGTSILAGYIGMRIAVYTNTRTTYSCCKGENLTVSNPNSGKPGEPSTIQRKNLKDGFFVAFRGGQVLGFVLVGLALLILECIIATFRAAWFEGALEATLAKEKSGDAKAQDLIRRLFELVAGYGLGGSSVALFGRVGGGIYTKAADVGADLVGKVLIDLNEDDPSNPGTIADNVGDNVGDIAGMGADLFGSLAESTCAALVVSSTSPELCKTVDCLYFPLVVTSVGILASFLSVLCAHLFTVTVDTVQAVLKWQLGISTILMTICLVPAMYILPDSFTMIEANGDNKDVSRWGAFGCIMFGLWSGMIIGFVTEYYTSNAYGPTLKLCKACEMGPAPNIIQGLALGYMSTIIPIICLTATIAYAFAVAGMYGVGLSALGMLGSLPVALTIDGYGPISDNAGGIAEMSFLPSSIRDRTDALDAAGNTTAAVGKGFAIGSAGLVGLALFGAFVTRIDGVSVDILQPTQFAGLLVGAMLPYAFSALTMTAVGDAAQKMMEFIIQDYNKGQEEIKAGRKYKPDYQGCITISTNASLVKMIAPGALVILTPLVAGIFFGPAAVEGLLAGAIVSGVQVAISASNTGGAWDNCKKEIEKNNSEFRANVKENDGVPDVKKIGDLIAEADGERKARLEEIAEEWEKRKDLKVAAVVGDTVGDPLKDTSGPAINILVKLSAITSLVFGSYIKEINLFGPTEGVYKKSS
jgi:inorganic pyrophosphatase